MTTTVAKNTFDNVAIQQVFTIRNPATHRYEQYRKLDCSSAIGVGRLHRDEVKLFRDNVTGEPDCIHEIGKPMYWTYALNVKPGSKVVDLTTTWEITHCPEGLAPFTPVSPLTNKRK